MTDDEAESEKPCVSKGEVWAHYSSHGLPGKECHEPNQLIRAACCLIPVVLNQNMKTVSAISFLL